MPRSLPFIIVNSLLICGSALAMPLPPAVRGVEAPANGPINIKVRRIEQIKEISTTAPAPRGALIGEHRVLVLMAQTQDTAFSPEQDAAYFERQFFARGEPSLADFYDEVSYGTYSLTGEVIGPFTFPGRLRDYAYGQGGSNARVHQLIKLAFARATTAINRESLKSYDGYNKFGQPGPDGTVDHFAVVFPAATDDHDGIFKPIWPHRGTIVTESNGWKLGSYAIISSRVPLGGLVHEFGHDLGLPDLYDRDDSSHGAGEWSTMASGSWLRGGKLPGHIGAWGKARLGWLRPVVVARSRKRVRIPASELSPYALKIPIGEIDSPEYFLLENRQQVGYDAGLPDHGLLIWHVDERASNNDNELVKLVDVEEPAATQDLDVMYRNKRPDHLDTFRAGRQGSFNDNSIPSARDNEGRKTGISVTHISRSGGEMLADFEVPTVRDPGGEPHRLMHDNYNFGVFSAVSLGKGGEKFVRFAATTGGYEVHGFEALLMLTPHARGALTLRIYGGNKRKPGKQLWAKRVNFTAGDDKYLWLKTRVDDPAGVRLGSNQIFWVGIENHDAHTDLAHNPNSNSKHSRFRMSRKAQLRNTFGPGRPVPDFILRVDGFGFLGGATPDSPVEADATDPLIVKMRGIDARLDKKEYAAATEDYSALLTDMENAPSRYTTWIPVVHNSLGVAAYQAGHYATAIDYFLRSLSRAQAAEDARAEADILENLGETYFHAGAFRDAALYCGRSQVINRRVVRPGRSMENLYWLGRISHARGDKEAANGYLDQVAPLVDLVFAGDDAQRNRWRGRIARARDGTAKGEDQGEGAPARLAQEHREERAIDAGEVKEEETGVWKIDLSQFGLEGSAFVSD